MELSEFFPRSIKAVIYGAGFLSLAGLVGWVDPNWGGRVLRWVLEH